MGKLYVAGKSQLDPRFMRDSLLRSFTQQLPDSYLLFYYPDLEGEESPGRTGYSPDYPT